MDKDALIAQLQQDKRRYIAIIVEQRRRLRNLHEENSRLKDKKRLLPHRPERLLY